MAGRGFKACVEMVVSFFGENILGLNLLIFGGSGLLSTLLTASDDEWLITCISYLFVLIACGVVCFTCKRGNLYYRNIEEDLNRPKTSRSRPTSQVIAQPVQDNEGLPLLSSLRDSDRYALNDNPSFSSSGPMEDSFGGIREPPPAIDDRNIVIADVHQTAEDSEQISPKPVSPEENGSSSSNAGKSEPQESTPTPDSGVALQTSQTSGEEQHKQSLTDPQL